MSSSFPTEPSYVDTFNLLPTQEFLKAITEFYIEGTSPDIVLTNGTLENGTFVATFSNSTPLFVGNTSIGLFCINEQSDLIGDKIIPLKDDLTIGYNGTTASYNLSLKNVFRSIAILGLSL